ncbi:MAG: hypothetical protein HC840_25225 [Leptolyngbyaceae cyanobacterium RM2_2_4]|nr:hypothetical protein [Leptolyngbyaceae cyanobacterium SM1_4_3]NJN90265.1 hypothetical protein [Leptolyngbyaceae cyanobacterium SL_5_14]NJO52155.1 hypothetical protein [Leptolyngbyaceae cyanobacterium RM2_2_4]
MTPRSRFDLGGRLLDIKRQLTSQFKLIVRPIFSEAEYKASSLNLLPSSSLVIRSGKSRLPEMKGRVPPAAIERLLASPEAGASGL